MIKQTFFIKVNSTKLPFPNAAQNVWATSALPFPPGFKTIRQEDLFQKPYLYTPIYIICPLPPNNFKNIYQSWSNRAGFYDKSGADFVWTYRSDGTTICNSENFAGWPPRHFQSFVLGSDAWSSSNYIKGSGFTYSCGTIIHLHIFKYLKSNIYWKLLTLVVMFSNILIQ